MAGVDPRLQDRITSASQIVFVCSGNAVRSAFAHLYAEHLAAARGGRPFEVRSLATRYRNATLFAETAAALRARGVDPAAIAGFRSTHVDVGLALVRSDAALFGMRPHHLLSLGEHRGRAYLLPELLGSPAEIADPVEDGADFDATFARVAECVERLLECRR